MDDAARALAETIPVPAIVMRDSVCVAANAAYLELLALPPQAVVGASVGALIAERVSISDQPLIALAAERVRSGRPRDGHLWCRIRDAHGREHAVRVVWRTREGSGEQVVLFFDAEPDAFGREMTDTLARVAGQLGSLASETDVLERAVTALAEHGLVATFLIIEPGDPLLRYGPTASPARPGEVRALDWPRPPRSILEQINPGFLERRAAFYQDGRRLVEQAYAESASELAAALPSERMVQAPLFLEREPWGALVVTGEMLTPQLASSIELFAELVARAIENVRLRAVRVERERLVALGEAAAVMAHEVRNPVAALLNAAVIVQRPDLDESTRAAMVRIIAEEAARLERLVEDLLALGRPLMPRLRSVSLEAVRDAALALLARRDELAGATVDAIDADRERPTAVLADEDLLQLAVLNVVRNAVQSRRGGASRGGPGRVRISCAVREGERALVIEDAGPGFSPEAERRLSEPFFTTRPSGTGLGLALVRRVLDAHRGRLEVGRSADLGGARVALWIPCDA